LVARDVVVDEMNMENTRTVANDSEFQNESMELVESIQNDSMNNIQLSTEMNSGAEESNSLVRQQLAKMPMQSLVKNCLVCNEK